MVQWNWVLCDSRTKHRLAAFITLVIHGLLQPQSCQQGNKIKFLGVKVAVTNVCVCEGFCFIL